jgi:carbon storage regulator
MLVLSRHTQESIIIDGKIRVTIVAQSGGRVRLGIEAPQNVPVHRQEIFEKLRNQKGAAIHDRTAIYQ